MGACPSCGEDVANTYDCRDCGDAFCVECRLPDDHGCHTTAESKGSMSTPDPSLSVPSGPRITAFVPVWRAVPWWGHALLAAVLVPVTTVLLAQTVYHERVTTEGEAWYPSRVYYLPLVIFGTALALPPISPVLAAIVGYLGGLPGTVAYAVQKYRD